jgi:hypothetical protein
MWIPIGYACFLHDGFCILNDSASEFDDFNMKIYIMFGIIQKKIFAFFMSIFKMKEGK